MNYETREADSIRQPCAEECHDNNSFSQADTSRHLFAQALAINTLICILLLLKTDSEWAATIGGIVIIGFIFFKGLSNPKEAIFLFFGIKLTFDALWEIKIFEAAGIGNIGLLELMVVPVIFLTFYGRKMSRSLPKWPVNLIVIYLLWVFLAMLLNEESFFDINLLVRQFCFLLGFILGLKYIEKIADLRIVANLIFLSTIIPIFVAFLQSFLGQFIDLPFFHFKMDTTRGFRLSGLYYDPGTMGMVIIISLATNLYVLQSNFVKSWTRIFHFMIIPVCLYITIMGATRSIIFVSCALITLFIFTNIKKAVLILPLILLVIILSKPFLDNVIQKSTNEGISHAQMTQMLMETEYRTMFTGRVGLWQDVWDKHRSGTWLQQLFGSGLSSNAHSTYFFLLLQIGWFGLMFYLFYHYRMLIYFIQAPFTPIFKYFLLSAIFANLFMGISASTVNYTSFQIAISFIISAGIVLAANDPSEGSHSKFRSN